LLQSYSNFELIIVDDCSVDKTPDLILKYSLNDSRIKFFKNQCNVGDYPNRNIAASYAKGFLLVFLDSDDYFYVDALSYIVSKFNQFPEIKHSTLYFNDDLKEEVVVQSEIALYNHFFKNNLLSGGPGARVFRRDFFEKLGRYPVKYGPCNDIYFNIIATNDAPILLLIYPYFYYRRHDGQESKNRINVIFNGYNYFNDLMNLNVLKLDSNDKRRLILKNKKRLVVNVVSLFMSDKKIKDVFFIFKMTKYTLIDFIRGIFA
jgi:glycosyltransferase involved in cell wall biosynthesis